MGRPRKTNVIRSKSGKSRGEIQVIHPETIAVRMREASYVGIVAENACNELAGFTLGILLLRHRQDRSNPGGITPDQFEAGEAWASIVRRHSKIMGYELTRAPKSPSFVSMSRGTGAHPDYSEQQIADIRDDFRNSYDAIGEHGHRVVEILYAVCVENRPVMSLTEMDYGNLRIGLNALYRVFRRKHNEFHRVI